MSSYEEIQSSPLLSPQPLTRQQRQILERFFLVNAIQRRLMQRVEDLLGPLAPYQEQRLFFQDVTGLTHFRRNFLATIGRLLPQQVDFTYQLAFIEDYTHRKHTYKVNHLRQVDQAQFRHGTVIETLNYSKIGCKVQRHYTVQSHHLYWEKSLIWINGQSKTWVDGLMHLQQQLNPYAIWLQQGIVTITEYT